MTTETKTIGIQSLQIGLNILEILAMEKEPLKFTDIQNLTSMTKSNLYKYLSTLCQFGLINRNPHTNTYTLGHKLVQLGNVALGQSSLIEVVIPYFKKITEKTNLTVLLAVPSNKRSTHFIYIKCRLWNKYRCTNGDTLAALLLNWRRFFCF